MSGRVERRRGPGCIPWIMKAAIIIAVVLLPGSPSESRMVMEPPVEALFAHSEAISPSMAPWPNFSGSFDVLAASPYARNEAIVAPAPGSAPTIVPMIGERILLKQLFLQRENFG